MYKVNYSANGFTSPTQLSDYLLLHAGEVTLGHGFKYFVQQSSGVNDYFSMRIKCFKSKPEDNTAMEAESVVKSLKEKYKIK